MVIEHYISDLLYRYNCVVVPNFGAFLTQKKGAILNTESNTFYPPTKEISFNEQLKSNDGLLVSYIADIEQTSFETVLTQLETVVKDWKEVLTEKGKIKLNDVGHLLLNQEGKIQFTPTTHVNYLSSSFGLTTFNTVPVLREILKKEVEELEEVIPFIITPEKRATLGFRPYLKYAAVLLLAISTSATVYKGYINSKTTDNLARQEAQKQVSKHIQEATFFDTTPLELPTITINTKTRESIVEKNTVTEVTPENIHHIVAGAFRYKSNADKKIKQLNRRGYNAAYLGTNAHGLHMVTYDRFTDVDLALVSLKEIKNKHSKDAWLFSTK